MHLVQNKMLTVLGRDVANTIDDYRTTLLRTTRHKAKDICSFFICMDSKSKL